MKIILIIVAILVIIGIIAYLMMPKGPNIKDFEYLKNPRITEKPDQKVIMAETKGDPALQAGKAIKLLFNSYYKIKETPKSMQMPAVRARWPFDAKTDKNNWVGLFALPVPNETNKLPEVKNPDNIPLSLQTWSYGTVAEILHVGSYQSETGTIDKLKQYITEQGYKIVGQHEEEYLKGPGMFSAGNPDKYMTIIRYRVEKIDLNK